jgi:hypothetical protein
MAVDGSMVVWQRRKVEGEMMGRRVSETGEEA